MLVTTINKRLMNEYGNRTVASWSSFSDQRIVIVVSPEEVQYFRGLLDQRYCIIPFPMRSMQHIDEIRMHEEKHNYRRGDYRWQAARFSWKVFAIEAAFEAFPNEDQVTWLDADSLLRSGFDNWLSSVVSVKHSVSFFGRSHKQLHAETGLIDFRGPGGREIFSRVLQIYKSLALFEFNEWTDSYVYTSVFHFNKHCFDISKHRGIRSSNPLYELDKGRHILHLKGTRKSSFSHVYDALRVLFRR